MAPERGVLHLSPKAQFVAAFSQLTCCPIPQAISSTGSQASAWVAGVAEPGVHSALAELHSVCLLVLSAVKLQGFQLSLGDIILAMRIHDIDSGVIYYARCLL